MPDDTTPHTTPSPTSILDRLTTDMKLAMKAGDKPRLNVIRMLLSEARTADLQKPPTTPEKMVEAYHKRLVKGREEYEKLGDAGRAAEFERELLIVDGYVATKAGTEETSVLVDDFLLLHPEFGAGDIGKATGMFMKQHSSAVDPKAANSRIREMLSKR